MYDLKKYSDEELIRQLRLPKPESDNAFLTIYLKYSNKVNAYCMLRVFDKEQTQDIIQDIWLEFINSVKNGCLINNIKSYLTGIAHNIIHKYNLQNQRKARMYINDEGIHLDGFNFNYNLESEIENLNLITIIKLTASNLDEPYREIYLMKKFQDMTFVEIAQVTGESIQSIKRDFAKASKMMHNYLKPYFDEIKQ